MMRLIGGIATIVLVVLLLMGYFSMRQTTELDEAVLNDIVLICEEELGGDSMSVYVGSELVGDTLTVNFDATTSDEASPIWTHKARLSKRLAEYGKALGLWEKASVEVGDLGVIAENTFEGVKSTLDGAVQSVGNALDSLSLS